MRLSSSAAKLAALLLVSPVWAGDDAAPSPPMPSASASALPGAIVPAQATASAEDLRRLAGRVEQLAAAIDQMPSRSSWAPPNPAAEPRDAIFERLAALEGRQGLLASAITAQGLSLSPSAPAATPQAATLAAPQAAMLGGTSIANLFTPTGVKTFQPGLLRTWLANFGARLANLSAPKVVVTYAAPTATVTITPPVAPIPAASAQAAAIMQPSTAPQTSGIHLFSRLR